MASPQVNTDPELLGGIPSEGTVEGVSESESFGLTEVPIEGRMVVGATLGQKDGAIVGTTF